jgi:hypothetical protein
MEIFILDHLKMEEEMDSGWKFFLKINIFLVILKMIYFMDKAFIFGIKINILVAYLKMVKKYLEICMGQSYIILEHFKTVKK